MSFSVCGGDVFPTTEEQPEKICENKMLAKIPEYQKKVPLSMDVQLFGLGWRLPEISEF